MLIQDLRLGFRRLRQSPGFAVICVLTLALGIGANTAIFTLVNAILLKSLPVDRPGELYRLGKEDNCCVLGGTQDNWSIYSWPLYKTFRDHTPEFSSLAAFQAGITELSVRRSGSNAAAEPFNGEFVSGNYFSTFGVRAFAGRSLTPQDDTRGAPPAAMISYRAWRTHFALDPGVIGAVFNINQQPFTIVGVAPPAFYGDTLRPDPPDFWLPLATEPVLNGVNSVLMAPGGHWLHVIGRLKPGASPATVSAELTTELRNWLTAQPDLAPVDRPHIPKQRLTLAPGGAGIASMRNEAAFGLKLLMTISGLVMLIACANIANLLLARGAAMRGETAIRVALGASRSRLMRLVIVESVLLAIAGAAAGLILAFAGARSILLMAFRGSRFIPIAAAPSLPVFGFAFAMALITALVFGTAPAWIGSRTDPAEALRGAGRGTRDSGAIMRRALVVLQVALSAVLLTGAGLLTQTLRNLEHQRFGFEPHGRMIVRVNPLLAGYKPERLFGLYQQIRERLPRIPGVISASYSLYSPMRGDNWSFGVSFPDRPPKDGQFASFDRVGPKYFETLGTRIVRGRTLGEQDTPSSPMVAVINEAFARKYFPKQDPIGQRFGTGDNRAEFEIVGVVEDTKYQDARAPAYPTFFAPFLQMSKDPKEEFLVGSHYIGDIELYVSGKPENMEASVRRTLAEIDPNFTVLDVVSLPEQLTRNFNEDRLMARLVELFGGLALLLASIGLYGVTAYSVARRTGEIGVRMALGADRARVIRLVLRGAVLQLGIGLAIGIPAALAGGRLMASQLYGVKSYDPAILAFAIAVLAAAALLAGFLPARKAASLDPMQALRVE